MVSKHMLGDHKADYEHNNIFSEMLIMCFKKVNNHGDGANL
jgi:hypothetical protein